MVLDFKHIYEVLATSILETLAPTRCVVCDLPGQVLCEECAAELPAIDLSLSCPRCAAPFGHWLCTECPNPGSEAERDELERLRELGAWANARKAQTRGRTFSFSAARAALSYEAGAKSLIRVYKDADELRLAPIIASLVCEAMRGGGVRDDWVSWADAIAFVPASREAVLRRGFDHMELVARFSEERTGLPAWRALECKRRVSDQRMLGRAGRQANRAGSFSLATDCGAVPSRIILVDDVFTTGATLGAAAEALLDAGALEVRAVALARVW